MSEYLFHFLIYLSIHAFSDLAYRAASLPTYLPACPARPAPCLPTYVPPSLPVSLSLPLSLSLSLSLFLSCQLASQLAYFLNFSMSFYLSFFLAIYLFFLSVSAYLPTCLSVYLLINLPVCESVCLCRPMCLWARGWRFIFLSGVVWPSGC